MLPPSASRAAPTPPRGLLRSDVPGRTDRLPLAVAAGSYIIPADVVSGLGEGNTLAGARRLDALLRPAPALAALDGGRGTVPIIAAGGEYVVPPASVRRLGGGDLARGHDRLDAFVKHVRAATARTLARLPGPRR